MQRNTVQRQVILDVLQRLKHPTVLDVNAEIEKLHPNISKTTIYRNLRLLNKDGIIHRILIPGDAERYDNDVTPHYHFKCKTCGDIYDIEMNLTGINDTVEKNYHFQVDYHDVAFVGLCPCCL